MPQTNQPDYSVFNNQYVRDLAWVIGSPPLMELENSFHEPLEKNMEWLHHLDKNPQELEETISKNNRHTLGGYFECLFGFWIKNLEGVKLLAENLQVRSDKETIGEFDFIIEEGGEFFHIETTVKFYLGIKNDGKWKNWIGPKSKDRLDIKLEKLLGRQSELSKTKEGKEALKKIGVDRVTTKILCKGCFFYKDGWNVSPENSHKDHLKGRWVYYSDFDKGGYIILRKPHWLAHTVEQKKIKLKEVKEPTLAATMYGDREIERIFVMPDSWKK